MKLFGILSGIDFGELSAFLGVAGMFIAAILWLNDKQDGLNDRFNKINLKFNDINSRFNDTRTRQIKIRGSLSLVFQKIGSRFDELETRISNIESFLNTKGYHIRERESRNEDYGTPFWNESGADEDTKIPE